MRRRNRLLESEFLFCSKFLYLCLFYVRRGEVNVLHRATRPWLLLDFPFMFTAQAKKELMQKKRLREYTREVSNRNSNIIMYYERTDCDSFTKVKAIHFHFNCIFMVRNFNKSNLFYKSFQFSYHTTTIITVFRFLGNTSKISSTILRLTESMLIQPKNAFHKARKRYKQDACMLLRKQECFLNGEQWFLERENRGIKHKYLVI